MASQNNTLRLSPLSNMANVGEITPTNTDTGYQLMVVSIGVPISQSVRHTLLNILSVYHKGGT